MYDSVAPCWQLHSALWLIVANRLLSVLAHRKCKQFAQKFYFDRSHASANYSRTLHEISLIHFAVDLHEVTDFGCGY